MSTSPTGPPLHTYEYYHITSDPTLAQVPQKEVRDIRGAIYRIQSRCESNNHGHNLQGAAYNFALEPSLEAVPMENKIKEFYRVEMNAEDAASPDALEPVMCLTARFALVGAQASKSVGKCNNQACSSVRA